MKLSALITVTFVGLVYSSLSVGIDRCGGGGDSGPKPLADISSGTHQDTKMLPSIGNPNEFLFWEKANRLVYRNEKNEIYASFQGSSSSTTKLATSTRSLSRIKESQERYLVAESSPNIFDRKRNRWFNYALDARPFRHLFWNRDRLYSISARIDEKNYQYINVYEYRVGENSAQPVCKTVVAEPGQHFRLAEGHSFPNVYFYRESEGQSGKLISIYGMDVSILCKIVGISQYTREIAGPVKNVRLMPALKGLIVEVEHPTKNLLWDNDTGCRYFNIGQQRPLILNEEKPIIATWNATDGLTLIHLNKETKSNVGWGSTYDRVTELSQKDVWLADDGMRLFLTPGFEEDNVRWLFEMKLQDSL